MHVIALVAEKGGVGKTTLALDLAVTAAANGVKSAVIDLDPQATASQWGDRREAEFPWIVSTHATRIKAALEEAKTQGVGLVVIDTPPHSSHEAALGVQHADLVVMPVEPHLFSLETVSKQANLLRAGNNSRAFYVINKAPTQGTEAESAIAYIRQQGFSVCPAVLHLRAAHRHAANLGQTAAEYQPASKAAQEALHLYRYTWKVLNKSVGSNHHGQQSQERASQRPGAPGGRAPAQV